MTRILFYIIIIYSMAILITSCAQIKPPTGGPRDTIPPIRVSSNPANKSLNFKGKTISMVYDEKLKADKLKEQLIITPLIEFNYDFIIKKNTFKINFDETFHDSVTYTLNFRESIQDITEGNPTEDNKFTFSTGNYIDSLSITGYVKELMTYDTLENILVGLYKANDTVTISNGSPYYFTEVNEDGQYLIENIKNGSYLLHAFLDQNKNLKLESNKETYGFVADTIRLDSGTTTKNINLIKSDLTTFKLMSASVSGKNFDLNFNKYITDYEVNPLDTNQHLYTSKTKENKSIRFYNTFENIDSLQVFFTAMDSIKSELSDTVYIKFTESKRKQDEFKIKLLPERNTQIEEIINVELQFNKPVIEVNTDSMFVQFDTTRMFQIHDSIFQWSKNKDMLSFDLSIDRSLADTILNRRMQAEKQQRDSVATQQRESTEKMQMSKGKKETVKSTNKGLQLYFGAGSFISVENDTSTSLSANYRFVVPEESGTQTVNISSDYANFTVQLLKENMELVQEFSNSKSYVFRNIPPGNYKIRVLIDANGDGQWSLGNMLQRIEPEPVYIYPDVLVIRADWQTSLDLSF